jgi:hypothetical protein
MTVTAVAEPAKAIVSYVCCGARLRHVHLTGLGAQLSYTHCQRYRSGEGAVTARGAADPRVASRLSELPLRVVRDPHRLDDEHDPLLAGMIEIVRPGVLLR